MGLDEKCQIQAEYINPYLVGLRLVTRVGGISQVQDGIAHERRSFLVIPFHNANQTIKRSIDNHHPVHLRDEIFKCEEELIVAKGDGKVILIFKVMTICLT